MIKIFKFCKPTLAKFKWKIVVFLGVVFSAGVFSLLVPYISGDFIDFLISAPSKELLYKYCLIFAFVSVIGVVLGFVANRLYVKLETQLTFDINASTIKHIQKLSISVLKNKDMAQLAQQVQVDSKSVINFCFDILQNILLNVIKFLIPFIVLLSFNFSILFLMLFLVGVYFLTFYLFRSPLYRSGYQVKERQVEYFGKIYEQLSRIKFIKVHGIVEWFDLKVLSSFKKLYQALMRYQLIQYIFSGLDNFVMTLAQIALFIIGGSAVIEGTLSIGQFAVATTFFGMMMASIRYFFGLGKTIQDALVSYNRLNEIYEIVEERPGFFKIPYIESISVKNLSFSYNSYKVFESFNVSFKKGNIYALTGCNGSGKTTLINLILGLYKGEYQGNIVFNKDTDLEDVNMEYARMNLFGVSEQEPTLLAASMRENLCLYSNNEINENCLTTLINVFNMDEYFNKLPNGLDTVINEKSDNLSGGEKQKIALIRTLAKKSDVLILDEPTSALDIAGSRSFLEYLKSIKKDKIIILVTHNNYVIDSCDENIHLLPTSYNSANNQLRMLW